MKALGSYLDLLRSQPEFRRLWLADVVSFAGDWLNLIALYAVVMGLTDSTQALAAVMICKTLPVFLISPLAGSLADRFDRRALMIGADLGRALCVGGLIWSHQAGSLAGVFAVLLAMVLLSGIFIPAKSAALPQVVEARSLLAANALSSGTWSVMLALGAAAGGVITGTLGVEAALAMDGLSFLLSAAFLWRLPPLPPDPRPPASPGDRPGAPPRGGLREGLTYLLGRPTLLHTMTLKSSMALSSGALVMLPLFGAGLLPDGQGPLAVGLLYGGRGLGALVGSLLAGQLREAGPGRLRALPLWGFAQILVFYGVLSVAPSLGVAILAYFMTGMGEGLVWVPSTTLLQISSEPGFRGRLFAWEFGLMTLASAGASWGAGWLAEQPGWSPRDVARLSGLVVVPSALLWALEAREAADLEAPGPTRETEPAEGRADEQDRA